MVPIGEIVLTVYVEEYAEAGETIVYVSGSEGSRMLMAASDSRADAVELAQALAKALGGTFTDVNADNCAVLWPRL